MLKAQIRSEFLQKFKQTFREEKKISNRSKTKHKIPREVRYIDGSRSSLGVLLLDWCLAFDFDFCFEFLLLLLSRFTVEFDLLRLTRFAPLSCFKCTVFFDELLLLLLLLLFFDLDKLYLVLRGSFLKQQRWVRYCHLSNTRMYEEIAETEMVRARGWKFRLPQCTGCHRGAEHEETVQYC